MAYDVTADERNQISQGLYAYCRGRGPAGAVQSLSSAA
jgi:hypothetical protein